MVTTKEVAYTLDSWFHVWRISADGRKFVVESSQRFSEHYKPTKLSEVVAYAMPSGKPSTEEIRLQEYEREVTEYVDAVILIETYLNSEAVRKSKDAGGL